MIIGELRATLFIDHRLMREEEEVDCGVRFSDIAVRPYLKDCVQSGEVVSAAAEDLGKDGTDHIAAAARPAMLM